MLVKLSLLPEYFWTRMASSVAMAYYCPLVPGNVLVSVAVMKHRPKQLKEERADFSLRSVIPLWGGRNSEIMEECCPLVCSSYLALPAFLCNPGPGRGQGWQCPQWNGPSFRKIIKEENALQTWQQVCLMEAFSQLWFPLSRLFQPVSSWRRH